jgi:alpha-1,2-mannosyltransferase
MRLRTYCEPANRDPATYSITSRETLHGRPLYADGTTFATRGGIDLPFTYPPLAAIMFSPLAVVPLQAAEVVITVITFLLLGLSTWIVLTGLRVWPHGPGGEPASVRRAWLAAGLVAAATIWLEPIQANFSFGQVNAVLMTLVIADCVPRRTPWPRGVLLGIAIALKLTPAVFLLYFLLRRDARAALTSLASFVVATLLGCALAWRDSVEYWTTTVRHTDRIGTATLNTNQNAAGALARLGLGESAHFLVWTVVCLLVLALTVWAARRVSRADEPELVLICVALFGLVVSPVSWSHHWVWALPTVLVLGVLAYRRRNPALAAVCVAGVALMVWPPLYLLPEHHEASAAWWRQLFGMSYVWWALTVIAVSGATVTANRPRSPGSAPAADLVRPGQ